MKTKKPTSQVWTLKLRAPISKLQAGFFNPRALLAFALFITGASFAAFAVTPSHTQPTSATPQAQPPITNNYSPITGSLNANQLPPGVPLPPGAQFSLNNRQGDPLSGNPAAGPGFPGTPLRAGTASGANSVANPGLPNSQPAPATSPTTTVASSQASSAGSWSIVNSPDLSSTDGRSRLSGITCVSASDCWAVGSYDPPPTDESSPPHQTLIEHWDGASWTLVTSPNITVNADNVLNAVACNSASDCWAVGENGPPVGGTNQTLIEHWDGTSWTVVPSPNVLNSTRDILLGVTCASTSECWAVGYYQDDAGQGQIIERWDGGSWTIVVSPNVPGTGVNSPPELMLSGVACTSATECWAVGYYRLIDVGPLQTLIERWDGTAWGVVTSLNTSTVRDNLLISVACTSASDCWAVGESNVANNAASHQTLIEHWDGTLWSISPNTGGTGKLLGVACASASDCWAVGGYNNQEAGGYEETLVEHWDGILWTVVNSPTGIDGYSFLTGVSCTSALDCRAVGVLGGVGSLVGWQVGFTLIEHWDGASWTFANSPDAVVPKYPVNPSLNGVTCSSASDCWAVGSYTPLSVSQFSLPLIEHWDGNSWTAVPSPNVVKVGSSILFPMKNFLYSVTCASASECWAVGYYYNGSVYQTLIVHWDGTSWTVVSSPTSQTWNVLTGVTCASTTDCWAVGYQAVTGGTYTPLIEHWDGNAWTVTVSPPVPGNGNSGPSFLSQVACAAATDCWAVGNSNFDGATSYQTLIERWDGIAWTIVTSPNTSAQDKDFLTGVACASASDCWAVGYWVDTTATPTYHTLVEQWNGTSWAIVGSPSPGSSELLGVTCPSASECWAVGGYVYLDSSNNPVEQTLIEHWDGTSWTVAASSNGDAAGNILRGLACSSRTDCWAVGTYGAHTLVEHYPGGATPLAAVSRKTHGAVGTFDINLPIAGTPGIECRSGGANGDHSVVLALQAPVTRVNASIASGIGSVGSTAISTDRKQVTLNLTGVTNAQKLAISLTAFDSAGGIASSSVPMGVLLGDVNASGHVDAGDIGVIQKYNSQTANRTNFRADVNVSGHIDAGDVGVTQRHNSTGLPSTP